MKCLVSLAFFVLCAFAPCQETDSANPNAVVRVATALNHLTVLEFHEPVTMAAAGSSDFQIEREANKVFIKPIKSGVATDLFVWTASQRFAYELEITQEIKDMNFAIDSAQPTRPPKPVVDPDTDQFADVVLTRALLGAEEIKRKNVRKVRGQINVRVEQVLRTRTTLYIHYTIENNSRLSYRVNAPEAYELRTNNSRFRLRASLTLNWIERNAKHSATHLSYPYLSFTQGPRSSILIPAKQPRGYSLFVKL